MGSVSFICVSSADHPAKTIREGSIVIERKLFLILLYTAVALFAAPANILGETPMRTITTVADEFAGPAARHGATKLVEALRTAGVTVKSASSLEDAKGDGLVVVGEAALNGPAVQMLKTLDVNAPTAPESLVIRRVPHGRQFALILCGADDRGTMYAALDAADRVSWAFDDDPFSGIDASEAPHITERAISCYTMNRRYWESRFYDEAYWARYFDMLARDRINSFVVIFGYENGGFLAPPYPYFFDLESFPGVKMSDITPEQQARNLASLNRMIELAHARGVDMSVGVWDHIYRGKVQAGGTSFDKNYSGQPPSTVTGVNADNLRPYTIAALTRFLELVPALDEIQFRMHGESGLKRSEMDDFWRDVFQVVKDHNPEMRFDARAKGLPDSVIETGLAMDMNLRICTKYWMEQMGQPFHPTHVNKKNQKDRRHQYADLLTYPRRYKMHWRMWNGGTTRVLLWSDPEYVRRFCESLFLYDSPTFEVNEPLCTKMEGQPHGAEPFDLLGPEYRYYDYEFERYWRYYRVWGRVSYNPDVSPDVWNYELERRLGKRAAPHAEAALDRASRVLPRIVASCYPYTHFPMTKGWAEKQPLGDLPSYAKNEGTDIELFANFKAEASLRVDGGESAKVLPSDNSRWFIETAEFILEQVGKLEAKGDASTNRELAATIVDLKILAQLALFHGNRIHAAIEYNVYEKTKDVKAYGAAMAWERKAIDAWRGIVEAAGDRFADDLAMGARSRRLCGHWRDELVFLEEAFKKLRAKAPKGTPLDIIIAAPPDERKAPSLEHTPPETATPGKPLTITATASKSTKWIRLRYRNVTQFDDYQTLEMQPTSTPGEYEAVVPGDRLSENLDFMYFFEVMGANGKGAMSPDFEHEAPYFIIELTR